MASAWGKPGVAGGMAAVLGKQQAELASVADAFQEEYGQTPLDYVNSARSADKGIQRAAVDKMGVGGESYHFRSRPGQRWTENNVPSDSPSKDVIAYHAAEDSAKLLASAGKLDAAVDKVDEAIRLREQYERKIGRTDKGHTGAISLLRARRNSMSNLFTGGQTSQNEAAAKTKVRTFYTTRGVPPPAL